MNSPDFRQNPFFILQATPRDSRRRLIELTAARELDFESGVCDRARADLVHPRTRLAAELGWLPGVSPDRSSSLFELLRTAPQSMRAEKDLPPLARANLLAAAWLTLHERTSLIREFMLDIDGAVAEISAPQVMTDINTDRAAAGFPPLPALGLVEPEFAARVRCLCVLIAHTLDALPAAAIVEIMSDVVATATRDGRHTSMLLDELVDRYELAARAVMAQEAALVIALMDSIRGRIRGGSNVIAPLLTPWEDVLRNWTHLARPMQLNYHARGLDHKPSVQLGNAVIGFSVEMWNEHVLLDAAIQVNHVARGFFAEVPQIAERLQLDQTAFANIALGLKFSGVVGWPFKRPLSISTEGVRWRGKHHPIGSITRIRFGAVVQNNGLRGWTEYTIGVGDVRDESCIRTRDGKLYARFTEILWRTVGTRLLGEFFEILKAGGSVRFGKALFRDDGVELPRRRPFGKKQVRHYTWDEVIAKNSQGLFRVSAKPDSSAWVLLSFKDGANVHIVAKALELVLTPPFKHKMSELLKS